MASPYSEIVDNFNRTDEGPPPSSNWDTPAGVASGLLVDANQCAANVDNVCAGVWNVTTYNANCEVRTIIPVIPVVTSGISIAARVKDVFTGIDAYTLSLLVNSGTDDVRFRRVDNGVATTLKTVSLNFSNGYGLMLRMIDTVMYGFYYDGSNWKYLDKYDTSGDGTQYPNGGYAGLIMTDTTQRTDDFGAGNIGYSPAFRRRMAVG